MGEIKDACRPVHVWIRLLGATTIAFESMELFYEPDSDEQYRMERHGWSFWKTEFRRVGP